MEDNISFPCWYLQAIEHWRTDVTIVDMYLLNASWYPVYLKNGGKINFGYTEAELDTLSYCRWISQPITIQNPADTQQVFSWQLKPAYYAGYLLRSHRLVLDILQQNLFQRDIYFTEASDSSYNLFLGDYLTSEGVVARLRLKANDLHTSSTHISPNFLQCTMEGLSAEDLEKSPDALETMNGFR